MASDDPHDEEMASGSGSDPSECEQIEDDDQENEGSSQGEDDKDDGGDDDDDGESYDMMRRELESSNQIAKLKHVRGVAWTVCVKTCR